MRLAALSIAILAAGSVYGQETPAQVTTDQVAAYRGGMDKGCRNAGQRRGDPQAKVDGFCSCMMKVLDKSMTPDEWKRAVLHALKRQDHEEMLVLRPHMPKVQVCSPKS
jgi:hypothetical protein